MKHRIKGRILGRKSASRRALLKGLAVNFFTTGRIHTTEAKAKALRPEVEKMITVAKADTLLARRQLLQKLNNRTVVDRLLKEIAPRYKERNGGYTRFVHAGQRKGDGAETVIIELV